MKIFATTILVLAIGLTAGCGQKAGEIFSPPATPLVWPDPPEPPRIRYVGQLTGSADLKPAVSFGQQIGDALFGKKPQQAFLTPYAVCTDNAQRVFVADSNAQLVHALDLATRKYQQIRPAAPTRFSQPVGIARSPAGTLYVADSTAGCIYTFDDRGQPTGNIAAEFLKRPCGLAFDPPRNRLLVADVGAHAVVSLTPDGRLIQRSGGRGTEPGQFNYPTNVAVDSTGNVYVSDSLNFRIQVLNPELQPLRIIGKKGDMPGYFSQPKGIALDTHDHLYVVDANFEAVQVFNSAGELLLTFGEEGRAPGQFWLPAGIFIDANNRIWIGDCYNRRVQVFDFLPEVRP